MRVLITQPQALGGSVGLWNRLANVDTWIVLGNVQYSATMSNGDGTARKTMQGHVLTSAGWAPLRVLRRMRKIWDTPIGAHEEHARLLAVLAETRSLDASSGSTVGMLLSTLDVGWLGDSGLASARIVRDCLGLPVDIIEDRRLGTVSEGRTARLVELVQRVGGSELLVGLGMRAYVESEAFRQAGIEIRDAPPAKQHDRLWIAHTLDKGPRPL